MVLIMMRQIVMRLNHLRRYTKYRCDEGDDKDTGDYEVMESNDEEKKDTDKYQGTQAEAQEGGGSGVASDKLTAITNDNYENELQKLYDTDENAVSYNYFSLPNPMLDKAVISNKTFLKDMRSYVAEECKKYSHK